MPHHPALSRSLAALALCALALLPALSLAQVTLLVPSEPEVASSAPPPAATPPRAAAKTPGQTPPQTPARPLVDMQDEAAAAQAPHEPEVDVLITMMRPHAHQGLPMDMPQLFTVLRYDRQSRDENGRLVPERHDLLGDVEEIVYMGQRAWGANVALPQAGLRQFLLEARPWWDGARDCFVQHYVKVLVPVLGQDAGWAESAGQRFEIVPSTRPFGLTAPCLFAGQALFEGRPLAQAAVRFERINTDDRKAPTPWHERLEVLTDSQGRFAAVLNQPGWWSCMATTQGAPLKGPDGQNRSLELGSIFWLYVDANMVTTTEKRK